jgi:uncharacterized coiled-coil protein SlyX
VSKFRQLGVGTGDLSTAWKGGTVSKHTREGRVGRGRWAVAAVSVAAMVFVSACSGDDDDNASSSSSSEDTALATAQTDLEQAQADLDAANAKIADQESQITDLNTQLTDGQTAAATMQSQLAAETARADKAESDLTDLQARVDAVTAQFPITISSSLEPYADSLVGAYTLHLTEAFCDGISTCGQPRPDIRSDIIQGPNGLQLQVPNVFTTGLFMVEGALFGVTDSDLIVGPCSDGTQTNSQVSTTIFANDVIVADDGTQTLSGLRASVMVAVDPAGSCSAGNVFFSATLTPV